MKKLLFGALAISLLAGCGAAPQVTGASVAASGLAAQSAPTQGLFSRFKEADYQKAVSVQELYKLGSDEALNKANVGKKFKAEGTLGASIGDMDLVDKNDVTLSLKALDGDHYAYVHRERFLKRSTADAFIKKVGADGKSPVTVFFTLKSGNINSRIHIDAVKLADGRVVTL